MTQIIAAFRAHADGLLSPGDLAARIRATNPPGPLVNGYAQGQAGARWMAAS
jgi:hypothetical protein